MKTQKLRLTVEINPLDVVKELSMDEAVEFIKEIDLGFANVGFTEKVIRELIESIKDDLSADEWEPYQNLLNNIP